MRPDNLEEDGMPSGGIPVWDRREGCSDDHRDRSGGRGVLGGCRRRTGWRVARLVPLLLLAELLVDAAPAKAGKARGKGSQGVQAGGATGGSKGGKRSCGTMEFPEEVVAEANRLLAKGKAAKAVRASSSSFLSLQVLEGPRALS